MFITQLKTKSFGLNKAFPRIFILKLFLVIFIGGNLSVWAQEAERIVRAIKVQGNERVDSANILYYIKTKVGEPLSLRQIRRDIEQVFSLGQFKDIRVDTHPLDNGVEVIFIVEEISSIGDVRIIGNHTIEEIEIRKNISIRRGTSFKEHRIKDAIEKITSMYHERGYFFVKIKIDKEITEDGPVNVLIRIKEGNKVRIEELRFTGNRAIDDDELADHIETREKTLWSFIDESGIYKKDVLKLDMLRLEAFYQDNGYYRVRVLDPKIDINKKEKSIHITIPVEEGFQYKINEIKAKGDDTYTAEEIVSVMQLKKGDIFNVSKFREDIITITEIYSRRGFAYADVNPITKVDDATQTVDLKIQVDRGNKVYVGTINIVGNSKTRDNVIRREFRLREGELFDSARLKRSKDRLNNLGFFEDVKVDTHRGKDPDLIDIETTVTERPTGSISIGAGFSSVENLIFNASVSQDNLFGRGQRLIFSTNLSSTRLDFNISFTDPRIFDTNLSAGIDAFRRDSTFFSFDSSSSGGGVRVGKAIGEYDWLGLNYRYEKVEISGVSDIDSTEFLTNETRVTSRISPTYIRDTRNNFLNPSSGIRHVVQFELAGGVLGGANFYRMSYDGSYFYPLIGKFTAMARARVSLGTGYNGELLPAFERYFMGGSSTLRGYTIRDLGPQNSIGQPLGGDQSLLFNLELQYQLTREFRLFAFYDRGNIWGSGPDLDTTGTKMDILDMRHSIGGGLRFLSPFGPIGISYGLKLDLQTGEKIGEFHFSAGG